MMEVILFAGLLAAAIPVRGEDSETNGLILPPITVSGTNSPEVTADQRLPDAVTTVVPGWLQQSATSSLLELPRTVPNFSVSEGQLRSFSDNYVVRGIGNTEFVSDPAVALYVDDVPFSQVAGYTPNLLLADHVDFYRGPQGSRFGMNSESGVINVVTRTPGDQFQAEAAASGATFYTQEYQAMAQGPLIKGTLYFSVAGQFTASDGFIRDTFLNSQADESEGAVGLASVRWTPSQNWEADLMTTADSFDDGLGFVPLGGNPRVVTSDFPGKVEKSDDGEALRVRGTADGIAVLSVSARRYYSLDPFAVDLDISPASGNAGIVRQSQDQWSEELRARPAIPDDSHDWQAGFFYLTSGTRLTRITDFNLPPLAGSDDINAKQGADTYALFGEYTSRLGRGFEMTMGLRLDDSFRTLARTRISTLGSPPPVNGSASFYNAAPKLTLAYHLTDDALLYASTGLGFKPGGFSATLDPPASPEFQTERVWANEAGAKTTWWHGRLTANLALFYYDITDYQVEQFTPSGFDIAMINAPHAYSTGGELELAAHPARGLELSAFAGFSEVRLRSYTDPFTGVTVTGAHPPFVPKFNAGITAEYLHRSGLTARVRYTAEGDTFYDAANTSSYEQPAYGLLEARAGYQKGHFGIFLFGNNLIDKSYYTKIIPNLNAGVLGEPRIVGLMAEVQY
jgi:iron complex outermembrane receptor protein